MLSLNINKLRNEVTERDKRKVRIYEKIMDLCNQRILSCNQKNDDYSCTYIVPNVIFGLPLYNVDDCVKFIMETLIKKGFEVIFAYPTTLHISWKPEGYNTDYKSNNNFIYNSRNMLEYKPIEEMKVSKYNRQNDKQQQGNQQQYKSIDDYIDSKPLIYDPNDINLFQNKLDNIFN